MPDESFLRQLRRIDLREAALSATQRAMLEAIARAAPNVETIALDSCSGLTASTVLALCRCSQVRGVSLMNVVGLKSIRRELPDEVSSGRRLCPQGALYHRPI
jgi:hypothetical protein